MILDYFDSKLDGDSWEELCNSCYRMRYQEQHFTEIPATYKGDAGIEGFTRTGVVNQCYYPEKDYSDDELYNHQRNKMTTDINKLLSNGGKLNKLGVPTIKEWHYVIPFYKDSRIVQHAETKKREVLEKKNNNPAQYAYIDDDFSIIIKVAEDFKMEITRIIRNNLTDVKLNLAIRNAEIPNWEDCDSDKTSNIIRKVKAIRGADDDDEDLNMIVDFYIKAYIKGMEIFRVLRVSYAEVFEDIHGLEQSYKKQVAIQTRMNTQRSVNSSLFNEILSDFENKLVETCKYLPIESIIELKTDIVSMWLADCTMQFK